MVAALCYGVAAVMQAMARGPRASVRPGGRRPGAGSTRAWWCGCCTSGASSPALASTCRLPRPAGGAASAPAVRRPGDDRGQPGGHRRGRRLADPCPGAVAGGSGSRSAVWSPASACSAPRPDPRSRPRVSAEFKLALILAVAGIALIGVARRGRLPHPLRTPVLGAVAGLGYGVLAVAARVLPGFSPSAADPDPGRYALAAAGRRVVHAVRDRAGGRQRDRGHGRRRAGRDRPAGRRRVLFLGDHTRPGLGGVAMLGFALAVVCAVALARFGEATEEQAGADRGAAPAAADGAGRSRQPLHRRVTTRTTFVTALSRTDSRLATRRVAGVAPTGRIRVA